MHCMGCPIKIIYWVVYLPFSRTWFYTKGTKCFSIEKVYFTVTLFSDIVRCIVWQIFVDNEGFNRDHVLLHLGLITEICYKIVRLNNLLALFHSKNSNWILKTNVLSILCLVSTFIIDDYMFVIIKTIRDTI